MILTYAAILMVGIWLCRFVIGHAMSPGSAGGGRRPGLRSLVLALALALASAPTGIAWAKASGETTAEIRRNPAPAAAAPSALETGPSQAQGYAAREASAKGLEKFEGGDTVIIGSTALVVIVLVVLILVLI